MMLEIVMQTIAEENTLVFLPRQTTTELTNHFLIGFQPVLQDGIVCHNEILVKKNKTMVCEIIGHSLEAIKDIVAYNHFAKLVTKC